jgi:hypothetical protein
MKISKENFDKIKLVFETYCKSQGIDLKTLTLGDFFHLHNIFYLYFRHALLPQLVDKYKIQCLGMGKSFIIDKYEDYPDNSNDSHLMTVYKKLIS